MNNPKKIILPNNGNLWVGVSIFGSIALYGLTKGVYEKVFFSSDMWKITFSMLIPLIWITLFIKMQKVVLSAGSILHSKLGFFKIKVKEFALSDLDYWKVEKLTLVVVKKGVTPPELPHGFFEDISQVMLIPTSLYMPRTHEITEFLTEHGVLERKR